MYRVHSIIIGQIVDAERDPGNLSWKLLAKYTPNCMLAHSLSRDALLWPSNFDIAASLAAGDLVLLLQQSTSHLPLPMINEPVLLGTQVSSIQASTDSGTIMKRKIVSK